MPGHPSLVNRYREVAIKTASPLQLVVMLYDAAICCIQEAREQLDRKDIEGRSRSVNKCTAIISELQSCLNLRDGGEIAGSLNRLYDYMKKRIFDANIEQNIQIFMEIEILLDRLRSAWAELACHMPAAEDPMAPSRLPTGNALGAAPSAGSRSNALNISI